MVKGEYTKQEEFVSKESEVLTHSAYLDLLGMPEPSLLYTIST